MVTNLRLLRVRKGLTVRKVAAQLGVNETWYCRMERGQNYIPPHYRQKLAEFFGVPVSEICDPTTGWPVLIDQPMPKLVRKA
ncbi:MAG: helix-turn-helix domain-containing protein [Thermanaeromonas sp.]|uniref:helix-turn-helix domain-containing protein n=1 Tax=Thermanaeromonas sp. TaxID=2003697 RepID=UPI00243B6719|nr:helix-turn-helix transcriptional regulator [Thermanaeromonas sp.]MCG0277779.1 helix-turn-helix domain-containing protein [Thermanaeromonas sp.]